MTTLTAMLIAQKENNKNRHEPGEEFTNALTLTQGHMESDCWTLQEEERGTAATSFLHQLYKNREPGKGLLEGESS
ncbi:hypothetical protein DAPPUDRAFT_242199 [Daphnia pulex]|uniref:Uncharacterized protein n=1 Tax=Daphnia pulex TaxID=6669 RepID=E9GG30_DAPPU|nr:hypothetical protein DAPPUDRAFT_242199 [Daphnia pulex]|eukprot:EFX81568.1 hypothetical protein DAPPUDRAFT_242199 [Daphnia pulex]